MRKRDRAGRVLALPNQTPNLIDQYGLTRTDVDWELWAISPEDERWRGAAAANRTLQALGGFWGWIGSIYFRQPMRWIEDQAYRLAAENRSLLSKIWGAPPEWDE